MESITILRPREKDLGDFSVRRVLPARERQMVGPWIFFDHMGPAEFPSGKGVDVRPHPHINLATVTYLFEGEILHRDSLGSCQTIEPGDINLMVAGKGIVHSERERDEVRNQAHRLHGLQLWLALPEKDEETEPAFYHHRQSELPTLEKDGVSLRVMMGQAYGLSSPVKTFAETLYVEAALEAGTQLKAPKAEELAMYVVEGCVEAEGAEVSAKEMAIFPAGFSGTLLAKGNARMALIGGQKMSSRHIEWNFVSSRPERIEEAKGAWAAGAYPKVPGDEIEFIPLPS